MSDIAVQVETPMQHSSSPRTTHYGSINNIPEILKKTLFKEALFEFLGMYTFIVLSLGNVAIYSLYPSAQVTWAGLAVSWGLNLLFGIYVASLHAPGHLNPAVSLCMFIFEQSITLQQLILYTVSQFLGALVAAATVYGIYFNNLGDEDSFSGVFTTYKNPAITDTAAFFTEFLGTALLVGGIFMLIDFVKNKENLPIYIGAWLSTLVLSFGYQTAFAWNPARDLGPRILTAMVGYKSFSYMDHYWWIPLVGSYTGGVFGVCVYKFIQQIHHA
jgi:MIP family channel proteins